MRASVELSRDRVWLERALAVAGAVLVLDVLVDRPYWPGVFEDFTPFPLALVIAVWLPLLARTRARRVADVRVEGDRLVVRGGLIPMRLPLARLRGARSVRGRRGASVLLSFEPAEVIALAVDDAWEAERFVDELRAASTASDLVSIPTDAWPGVGLALRVVATASALAYYLFVVRELIPGDTATYGLTALFAGIGLLVFHFVRRRPPLHVPGADEASTQLGATPGLRAHIGAHLRAPAQPVPAPPPLRLAGPDEPVGAWLSRVRAALAQPDAYRSASDALRAQLEQSARSSNAPLEERALALRILGGGSAADMKRRVAEIEGLSPDDGAWLEEVALAGDDDAALQRLRRRRPRFDE